MKITKVPSSRKIKASEEVEVTPEAMDLLFEAEDVAELIAEVTDEEVTVESDGETAEFTVGEDVYTVEAEGDEEILESRKLDKKPVKASRSTKARRMIRRRR